MENGLECDKSDDGKDVGEDGVAILTSPGGKF
jgi:hypothetical protein